MAQNLIKTYTAPKAYITIENEVAGLIRSISFTENISRSNVQGIGSLPYQEVPATSISCSFNIDQYFIDFETPIMKKILNRYGTAQDFFDMLTIGEFSFSITFYAKTATSNATDKTVSDVKVTGKTVAVLGDCYLNSQSMNLSEAGIAGSSVSGVYLTPVTYTTPSN